MPLIEIKHPDGRSRTFAHRGSRADIGVIRQIFVNEEYSLRRLRRCHEITERDRSIIAAGSTPLIVDAGANIGASVVYWGLNYPQSKIVAIEPNADNVNLLRANSENLNVQIHHAAIGSRNGCAHLIDPGEGEWGYRTEPNETGETPVISMENIMAANSDLEYINFIAKIDIEGGEKDLFSEETKWVDSFDVLIIELHDWMLPRRGTSRNFLHCISQLDRDFVHIGENIFSIRNWTPPGTL